MNQENHNQVTTQEISLDDLIANAVKQQNGEGEKVVEKSAEELKAEFFPEVKDEEEEEVKDPPKSENVVIETSEENEASTQATSAHQRALDYIENGFIENIEIEIGEGDDVKKVFLADLTDLDEDTLKQLVSEYKKAKDEEIKEKYISREGLDERTVKMVELKKAGGDLSELIEAEINYVNPISQFDLESERDQETLVRHSLTSQGIKPKVIEAQIEAMKEDFTLDLEAKKIAESVNKQFDAFVDSKKQEQLTAINAEKEQQKEFRKNVNNVLRDFNIPENISKVVLDNSTKTDEVGLTNTDKLYFDSKNNPELHAKIAFFLNNQEEFIKFVSTPMKNKTVMAEVNKVFKINPKNIKTEIQAPKTSEQEREDNLNKFFNT